MNRNPIMPFILIMVFGIGLMFFLSFKGLGDQKEIAEGPKGEEPKTEDVAANPEDLYKAKGCIGCHGDQYQGVSAPALVGVGDKYTTDQIKDILVNGKGAGMPAGLVPEEHVDAMADWLSSLK